jgi:tetratricopeptide (TPR) repeat protein
MTGERFYKLLPWLIAVLVLANLFALVRAGENRRPVPLPQLARQNQSAADLSQLNRKNIDQNVRIKNGKLLYSLGKYDEAVKLFREVLREDQGNSRAAYYLALTRQAKVAQQGQPGRQAIPLANRHVL